MSYEEPGIKVIQQLQAAAANIQEAAQVLTIAGPLYEVFEDQLHSQAYDALSGAGAQTFTWPGKKTTSIVDLAGVRKSIAEVDSQLVEYAQYPLTWRLRDPSTSQVFDIDPLIDVNTISQTGFKIVEGAGAAVARSAGAVASAAKNRELHLETGGLVTAGVVADDRILVNSVPGSVTVVQDDNVAFLPDGRDLTVKTAVSAGAVSLIGTEVSTLATLPTSGQLLVGAGETLELVDYTGVPTGNGTAEVTFTVDPLIFDHAVDEDIKVVVKDAPALARTDGDLAAASGYVTSAAGGLTGREGSRVVLWVENDLATDGAIVIPVVATGSMIALAKAALANNDRFTLGDGVNPAITFEFKTSGGFVPVSGRVTVDISGATDAASVAVIMRSSINTASPLAITAAGASATVSLTNDVGGLMGNVDITEVLFAGTLTPVGMLGGLDGNVHGVQPGSLVASYAQVGAKLTIWSQEAAEGMTALGTGTVATSVYTDVGTPFAATDVGRFVHLTISATPYIARIIGFTSNKIVTLSPGVPNGASTAGYMYGQQVRNILAVDATTGDITVDGTALTATHGSVPLVLHRPIYRDLVIDTANTDTKMRYSGSAVVSDTEGYFKTPFDVYDADVTHEIFPDYELLVTYRALDISSVNATLGVYQSSDLTALSTVSPSNPLLWAAQSALTAMGTTDTLVLLMPIDLYAGEDPKTGYPQDQNEALGYLNALEILERNDAVYFMVPLTRNATVRDAFVAHVLAQSDPGCKGERICYLTYDLPLGALESTTGIVAPGLEGGNKKITDTGQDFLSQHHLIPGNAVVITKPAIFAGDYVVGVGTTEDELVLEGDNWLQSGGVFTDAAKEFTVTDGDFDAVSSELASATIAAFKDVEVGDYLLKGTSTRRITAIKSAYQVLEYAGVALTGTAQTVSILRTHVGVEYYAQPYGKDVQATVLKTIAQGRGSRRVCNVWPDVTEQVTGTDSQGNEVREMLQSWFAAAAEAGRDAIIPPQRASTGAALGGFTGLEHSSTYFKKSQLNTIAGGGWAILDQRVVGGPVIMRHLLTTDMSTVKTQELAFTKNVDNMAKVKRASMEPLLNDDNGRINITKDFLTTLAVPAQAIFEQFVGKEQLVKTEEAPPYTILSIRQDPTAPDTILEDVELNVPLPANKVTVTFVI